MATPKYDLEDRTYEFAKSVRRFVKDLAKTTTSFEDVRQVVRSSGSVGANYIEANESLGKKDFLMRIRICRKEAKESGYWLRLIKDSLELKNEEEIDRLIQESLELTKIFSAIVEKSK
jgi:four helix bundle protein